MTPGDVTKHHTLKQRPNLSVNRFMDWKPAQHMTVVKVLFEKELPSHVVLRLELSMLNWFWNTDRYPYFQIYKLNLTRKTGFFPLKGHEKDSPALSFLMKKSWRNKADRRQAFPSLSTESVQARQEDTWNRRAGKDCRAPENGKLPGLHNQLVTFDQSEPRHQLLWDNRQRSEAWRACRHCCQNGSMTSRQRPGQQGAQSQKPMVALTEMLHEGGQNRQAAQRGHCFPPVDSAQWHSHKPAIPLRISRWQRNGAVV